MSELTQKQFDFNRKMAVLRLVAVELGYTLTDGDAYRDDRVPYGHPRSTHRSRLAEDHNIFLGGKLLTGKEADEAHGKLHDIWDMMGGAERIESDLNHYSFEWQGVR